MSNILVTESHKHCIFCGEVINFAGSLECNSKNNTTEPDTTGHKYHVYLS